MSNKAFLTLDNMQMSGELDQYIDFALNQFEKCSHEKDFKVSNFVYWFMKPENFHALQILWAQERISNDQIQLEAKDTKRIQPTS